MNLLEMVPWLQQVTPSPLISRKNLLYILQHNHSKQEVFSRYCFNIRCIFILCMYIALLDINVLITTADPVASGCVDAQARSHPPPPPVEEAKNTSNQSEREVKGKYSKYCLEHTTG